MVRDGSHQEPGEINHPGSLTVAAGCHSPLLATHSKCLPEAVQTRHFASSRSTCVFKLLPHRLNQDPKFHISAKACLMKLYEYPVVKLTQGFSPKYIEINQDGQVMCDPDPRSMHLDISVSMYHSSFFYSLSSPSRNHAVPLKTRTRSCDIPPWIATSLGTLGDPAYHRHHDAEGGVSDPDVRWSRRKRRV